MCVCVRERAGESVLVRSKGVRGAIQGSLVTTIMNVVWEWDYTHMGMRLFTGILLLSRASIPVAWESKSS